MCILLGDPWLGGALGLGLMEWNHAGGLCARQGSHCSSRYPPAAGMNTVDLASCGTLSNKRACCNSSAQQLCGGVGDTFAASSSRGVAQGRR
ncbi:MAG: hypothetical protein ACLVJH_12040 [Faecalibacterium prausnitzii]